MHLKAFLPSKDVLHGERFIERSTEKHSRVPTIKPPLRVLTLAIELALEDTTEATGSDSVLSLLHLDEAVGLCGLLIQLQPSTTPSSAESLHPTQQTVNERVICCHMR